MRHHNSRFGCMVPLLIVQGIAEPYNSPRPLLPEVYLQAGHLNAIRPVIIDARYEAVLDTLVDWELGEWLVSQGRLEMIRPQKK